MPVAVIALAAGSFAAGATAFAAATTIAGMVAAGATMAGAAMTMVGTVTGNAKLTKIGAIVGIAGGLGTMAVNASSGAASAAAAGAESGTSAASGVADVAGSAAVDVAADAAGTLPVAAPGGIEAVGDAATGNAVSTGTSSMGGMSAADTMKASINASAPGSNTLAQAINDPISTFKTGALDPFDAANTTVGQSVKFNAFQPQDLLHPASSNGGGMLGALESSSGSTGSATGMLGSASGSGFFSDIGAWAKANPELAKMALSGAGTAFGSLVPSAKDKAMMEAYKANAAASTQQTADAKRKALWATGRV